MIKSFNYKMPNNWPSEHIGWKLWYFTKNYVLPKVLGEVVIKKSDVTFDIVDKDKTVVKYQGDPLGVVVLVGTEMIFVAKHE
jgi:hypothetical protein